MPELPDITVYIEALDKRIIGRRLEAVRIASPFLVRTVEPPVKAAEGRRVERLRRVTPSTCIDFSPETWPQGISSAAEIAWIEGAIAATRTNNVTRRAFSTTQLNMDSSNRLRAEDLPDLETKQPQQERSSVFR